MPLALGASAFLLDRTFRTNLYDAERDALLAYTYSMMAVAEPDEGFLAIPDALRETPFNDPASGLYAQIVDDEYGPIWESISLSISPFTTKIPYQYVEIGSVEFTDTMIDGHKFFISRFNSLWEIEEMEREFQFVVIHSQAQLQANLAKYRKILWGLLGGLAILLIILQTIIIRWGLLPLKKLALDIKQLEAGSIAHLDNDYPQEILPVTHNINLLIDSEQKQQKRYKNTLGDLAHSLKTPLSVIRSVLNKIDDKKQHMDREDVIDEQVARMAKIIDHQLNRASTTRPSFQSSIHLAPLFKRILSALEKVYREKNVQYSVEVEVEDTLRLQAQESDLMEVFGNMLENAFKYGHDKILVSATSRSSEIVLTIEDNGPGVPESFRSEILKRGARVDTSTPGQGIGLAVAADILSSYDGGIHVTSSSLGGACFTITFPK